VQLELEGSRLPDDDTTTPGVEAEIEKRWKTRRERSSLAPRGPQGANGFETSTTCTPA
jgi:hypothetical protein